MIEQIDNGRVKFRLYDKDHPEIWERFESITLNLIERGWKKYSAYSVMHVIRFHGKPEKPIQVCNNYIPDYARKFMRIHPQYTGFFETRQLYANHE